MASPPLTKNGLFSSVRAGLYHLQVAEDAGVPRRFDVQDVRRTGEASPGPPPPTAVRHHVRQQGETVAAFVTRLRDLASHCEYGDSAKELIRDRLVCGIRNDHMQRGLLEVAKLTFEKAFEMALLHEAAEQNSRALNAPLDVHRTSTSIKHRPRPTDRTTDRATTACYRCGGRHLANDCRFRSSVCNYCKKKGHIQRVCRSRLRQMEHRDGSNEREPTRDAQRRDRDRDRAHRVDDETEPPPPEPNPRQVDYNMFVVCTNRVAPFTVRVEVEGAPLWMEIDTGAALSLISKTTYSQLWSEGRAPTWRNHLSDYAPTQGRS